LLTWRKNTVTGSAWKEYQAHGTVHGIPAATGLRECDPFPGGAIYTPSTKAELGAKDENIHPSRAREIVGGRYADRIEELALALFRAGQAYAAERGIILADTKFEFGLDEETDEVVLIGKSFIPLDVLCCAPSLPVVSLGASVSIQGEVALQYLPRLA
jgi:phosphoribosylaminoimidazole-succinocarboxamide synthase